MVRTELVIASGETETVASGETQDTATVSNAGTFENAGTNTAGGQELTTTAIDIDASSTALVRLRTLTSTATDIDAAVAPILRVRSLVATGVDRDQSTTALVRTRTLDATAEDIDQATADLFAGFVLSASASDIDQSTTTLDRRRDLRTTGVDIDASTSVLSRSRALTSTAVDNDAASVTLIRVRVLGATARDIDDAEFRLRNVININSERAVDTVIEILERDVISDYRNQDPTVLNYWDRTQQERGQGADQPAEIYVWETAGKDIERFSLDDNSTHDTASVEALVYSLDEQAVIDYAEDARNNIEQFFDDNKEASSWQTIEVTSVNDFREQTQRRSTDQYVVSLEIELEKIQEVA